MQGDPVKNLVRAYLGEAASTKRQVLTTSSVTEDDRGIRQLIANGCYHAAVNLTTQLLTTVYGQGEGRAGHPSKHTAHSIQVCYMKSFTIKKSNFCFFQLILLTKFLNSIVMVNTNLCFNLEY